MKTLRLRHRTCGRNLADVERPTVEGHSTNPDRTPDGLCVTPRDGVRQEDYRPWPDDPAADPSVVTYTWRCHCGAAPVRLRHARISEMWVEECDRRDRIVRRDIE